jgi:hypothetical protein
MRFLSEFRRFRFSPRLHSPWLIAIVVLGGAVWLFISVLPSQRRQDSALAVQLQTLEAQVSARAAVPVTISQDLSTQLASLDSLTLVMSDLQTLTAQNGMQLSDATFKQVGERQVDARIARIEVNARIKGPYLPLKKTLAAMLASHAGLALESLSLRRERATDVVMDIDLRFTYFYRKPT